MDLAPLAAALNTVLAGLPFTVTEELDPKGALSQKSARLVAFTLVRAASKAWRKLNGTNQLPRVIEGVTFSDGIAEVDASQNRAA